MLVAVERKDILEWRKRSNELRQMAEGEQVQQTRIILRNMATNYDMLAIRAESLLECAENLGNLFPEAYERVRNL